MGSRRVLVAQFFHETHGFNPQPTTAADIIVNRGRLLLERARDTGTTLAGIIAKLTEKGCEIVPALGVFARPSGPLDHEFYVSVRDELIALAREGRVDAIALDMHGAMGTTALDDADGDLLTRLRAAMGPDVPIGIGLDMHGHVTQAMLESVDICIACKECPHTDFPETGARVVECLLAVLDKRLRPVRVMAKAPMITLDSGLTAQGPFAEVKTRAAQLQRSASEIWDISLFQVYRFADYQEQKGQAVVVLANATAEPARKIAEELARWCWDHRARFREPLLAIDDALDRVADEPTSRPFVLGDMGDRTLAGAPGDGTAILARVLARAEGLKAAIPVNDPVSVQRAGAAGVGARLTLAIGGRITPGYAPLAVTGEVTHLGDGEFEITGPVFGGERSSLGPTAVLRVDERLSILLMSKPGLTHTPAAFTSQGIDLTAQDFIVVKSGQHFQANFAGIATPLIVETPGLSFPTKGFFPWKGPHFWPEHDILDPDIRAKVFQ